MRRSRTLPAPPRMRTRFSTKEDEIDESLDEAAVAAALWTTAVEVIRGVTHLSQDEGDEDDDEDSSNQRESPIPCESEEEDVYAAGMRNLLLSLDRNFESEVTEKHSNVSSSANTHQDPVVTVLQKSLSLSKSQKKKKKKYTRLSTASNDFYTRLPDIDEDRSLHVSPSLDDEYPLPLTDTSMSSSSSVEQPSPPKDAKGDEDSWKKQVRVQSQLPNVEVLLLRRASSLSRAGSLRSTPSLTPSLRSNCSTLDDSEYYYDYDDDEDDDGFSAFTRLRSYSSLQTNASNISYAFQEVEEEDDILADCHTFSWFGAK